MNEHCACTRDRLCPVAAELHRGYLRTSPADDTSKRLRLLYSNHRIAATCGDESTPALSVWPRRVSLTREDLTR